MKASPRGRAASRLFTIGHSTRTLDQLVGLLGEHAVTHLVDVRAVPRSRRHPHFTREALAASLPERGIAYIHLPGLGGLRKPRPDSTNTGWRVEGFRGFADYMETPGFEASLEDLLQIAATGPTAIMCAEAMPSRCHRTLISDALLARDVRVEHVLGPGSVRAHVLTPGTSVRGRRVTYPDRQGLLLPEGGGMEPEER